MTLDEVIAAAIDPALALLPAQMDSPDARVLLLAIGLQESGFQTRQQLGGGPAHGFWEFEPGGVRGVYQHAASRYWLAVLCKARGCEFTVRAIYRRLLTDDVLAAGIARLLIFTDPKRLPTDAAGGWALYIRTWRPGEPRPKTWAGFWLLASTTVNGAADE